MTSEFFASGITPGHPQKPVTFYKKDGTRIEQYRDEAGRITKELAFKDVNHDGKVDLASVTVFGNGSHKKYNDIDGDGFYDNVEEPCMTTGGMKGFSSVTTKESIDEIRKRYPAGSSQLEAALTKRSMNYIAHPDEVFMPMGLEEPKSE